LTGGCRSRTLAVGCSSVSMTAQDGRLRQPSAAPQLRFEHRVLRAGDGDLMHGTQALQLRRRTDECVAREDSQLAMSVDALLEASIVPDTAVGMEPISDDRCDVAGLNRAASGIGRSRWAKQTRQRPLRIDVTWKQLGHRTSRNGGDNRRRIRAVDRLAANPHPLRPAPGPSADSRRRAQPGHRRR
jgi:hypothetical protein